MMASRKTKEKARWASGSLAPSLVLILATSACGGKYVALDDSAPSGTAGSGGRVAEDASSGGLGGAADGSADTDNGSDVDVPESGLDGADALDEPAAEVDSAPLCALATGVVGCDECINSECAATCADCASNPACVALLHCLTSCKDGTCSVQCSSDHPDGASALDALVGKAGCIATACGAKCGADTSQCGGGLGNPVCDSCINYYCRPECDACVATECGSLNACLPKCITSACSQACIDENPVGVNPYMDLFGPAGCLREYCHAVCGY